MGDVQSIPTNSKTTAIPPAKKNNVTRPGIKNFDIQGVFRQYGYEPTQEEIDSLAPSFGGKYDMGERGTSAVAQYVQTKKAEEERQANDPLKAFTEQMQTRAQDLEKQSNELYTQLNDTLQQAPKLFGNLAPEQIQQYLEPLKQIHADLGAKLQGDFARRNIAGSSIEANAMAESDRKFKGDVLSTGLSVGMTQQQAQAAAIRERLNSLFGGANSSFSAAGAGAGQLSGQNIDTTRYMSQLPYFLNQSSLQQDLIQRQLNAKPSFWDNFERGIGTANSIFTLGKNATSAVSGMGGGAGGFSGAEPNFSALPV